MKKKSKERSNKSGDEVVKRKGGGGFCKICSLSPQLQEFVGAPEMARTEVVKQLWAYIREKNLQDPNNRQNINCDEPLRALFGVNSINMFQMNKVLTKHIWPLDSDDVVQVKEAVPKEKKKKKQEREDDDSDEPKGKEKRQKGGSGKGFLAPLQLSDALAKFLGESELPRSDVIKRMWDYIKGNNLQDPSDKRQILCDEKLKELFDVDSFIGFTVTKLLAPHFIKTEQANLNFMLQVKERMGEPINMESKYVITGATSIGSRLVTMRWKAKTKSYNFDVGAKFNSEVYIVQR
ncbi:upstream activation factor subunit spp27-like protein [Trifolium pratense]|uniref:Upstream activation factor subunit spp27-like protein n=1 Tax=Trifolium pratense TaxID=57577 RepID=A0A2K3NX87_TRIPR|nr:upstream activation factor subunit spp27-like protein [Trifolium pratense]